MDEGRGERNRGKTEGLRHILRRPFLPGYHCYGTFLYININTPSFYHQTGLLHRTLVFDKWKGGSFSILRFFLLRCCSLRNLPVLRYIITFIPTVDVPAKSRTFLYVTRSCSLHSGVLILFPSIPGFPKLGVEKRRKTEKQRSKLIASAKGQNKARVR